MTGTPDKMEFLDEGCPPPLTETDLPVCNTPPTERSVRRTGDAFPALDGVWKDEATSPREGVGDNKPRTLFSSDVEVSSLELVSKRSVTAEPGVGSEVMRANTRGASTNEAYTEPERKTN